LKLRIGGKEETHSLPRVDGFPYRIEIKNMDYQGDVYSDMPDYYQYLSSPAGNQFDLIPVIEDEGNDAAKGDAVDLRVFCHPIGMDDLASIDDLE